MRVNGEERTTKLQRPTIALLGLMVLGGAKAQPDEEVARAIWPEYSESEVDVKRRDDAFRQQCGILRKALGKEVGFALIHKRGEVRLDASLVHVDVWAFRDAARKALHSGEVTLLERASEIAESGELLPAMEAPWLEAYRIHFRKQAGEVWRALTDAWERAGKAREALALLERVCVLEPEDEWFLRRRWLLKLQLGERDVILREARALLDSGGGEPETRRLSEKLLRVAELPQKKLAPLALAELPSPRTRLLGREGTLGMLEALVPGTRLVTLTGAGGVGKTRLALEAARRLAPRFSSGVAFVDLTRLLSGARDYALVAELGRAVGLPSATETDLLAALAPRELLLLLDNAEHVLETARTVLGELLTHCPGVHLLTTTREPLRLADERVVPVGALPLPDAEALFWERAPISELPQSAGDRAAVTAICKRLEGLPLGIELAAGSLERFPGMVALASELERSLRSLASSTRDERVPERARTLWAAMEWSEALRSPEERQLLYVASVFLGGMSLSGLAAVVGWDEDLTRRLAEGLAHGSLFQREESSRWRLSEPLRAFAGERLRESGEEERARKSHAAWFVSFAEESPPPDAMERERANLESAQAYLLELRDTDLAHRLGAAMWRFWYQCGNLFAGFHYLREALGLPLETDSPALRETLLGAANLAYALRDSKEAARFAEEARRRSRVADDAVREARALGSLGLAALSKREFEEARGHFLSALERFTALGDPRGIRLTRDNLALTATEAGDFEAALRLVETNLPELREDGLSGPLLVALNNAAHLHLRRSEPQAARVYLAEALLLGVKHEHWRGLLQSLAAAITMADAAGELERCARLLGGAEALRATRGQPLPADAISEYEALEARVAGGLGQDLCAERRAEGAALPLADLVALASQ